MRKKKDSQEGLLPVRVGVIDTNRRVDVLENLLASPRDLTEEEIRQWLDDFLQQQQLS